MNHSFFVFTILPPTRSPMGVMETSAPSEKNAMPIITSTAPMINSTIISGERGAMTKLSISTITMTGSTAVTDSRAFSCILSFNVFLCIRNSLTNPFPANEIPLVLYSAVCWFPKICLPYLITDHSILPEFFQLFHHFFYFKNASAFTSVLCSAIIHSDRSLLLPSSADTVSRLPEPGSAFSLPSAEAFLPDIRFLFFYDAAHPPTWMSSLHLCN